MILFSIGIALESISGYLGQALLLLDSMDLGNKTVGI